MKPTAQGKTLRMIEGIGIAGPKAPAEIPPSVLQMLHLFKAIAKELKIKWRDTDELMTKVTPLYLNNRNVQALAMELIEEERTRQFMEHRKTSKRTPVRLANSSN